MAEWRVGWARRADGHIARADQRARVELHPPDESARRVRNQDRRLFHGSGETARRDFAGNRDVVRCPAENRRTLPHRLHGVARRFARHGREPVVMPPRRREMRHASAVRNRRGVVPERGELQREHARVGNHEMVRESGEGVVRREVGRRALIASRAESLRSRGAREQESLDAGAVPRRRLQIDAPERNRALLDDVRSRACGHLRHRNSLVVVLSGCEIAQPAGKSCAASVDARKDSFDAAEARRREPRARHDALHAELEPIAARNAADLHDAADEIAVRGAHRIAEHVDSLHGLEGQVDRRDARRGIGDVEAIDEERRVGRARAAHLKQAVGSANDRRQQRRRLPRLQVRRRQPRHRVGGDRAAERCVRRSGDGRRFGAADNGRRFGRAGERQNDARRVGA